MRKIVIDGRMYQQSGIGRYIRNLLFHLQILDTKNEYAILLCQEDYDNLKLKNNFKKVLANFKWYGVGEQIKLLGLLRSLKPDLVHFPHFNAPIFFDGKFVVTIHDLIHQHFQMRRSTTHDPITYKIKQMGYKMVFKNAIKKSQKILVPSEFVKKSLIDEWNIDSNKIQVTYEAVDNKIFTIVSKLKQEQIDETLKKFKIRSPFIFYVGNAHPHKNVAGLIETFLNFQKKYPHLQLVLSGHDHYFWQRLKREYQYKDIIYTGEVSDEELIALYKNAQCLVMPSFEEGFGIPILEAMACGCPVVSSNRGALMEVGGDAAIYFDPANRTDMTNKTNMVLKSENLRQDLIKRGKTRVKLFSWKKLAKKTLEVYKQCV